MKVEIKANGKLVDVLLTRDDGSTELFEACEFGPNASKAHVEQWAKEQADNRAAQAADPLRAERKRREAEAEAAEATEDAEIDDTLSRIEKLEDARKRLQQLESFQIADRVAQLERIQADNKAKVDALEKGGKV